MPAALFIQEEVTTKKREKRVKESNEEEEKGEVSGEESTISRMKRENRREIKAEETGTWKRENERRGDPPTRRKARHI